MGRAMRRATEVALDELRRAYMRQKALSGARLKLREVERDMDLEETARDESLGIIRALEVPLEELLKGLERTDLHHAIGSAEMRELRDRLS